MASLHFERLLAGSALLVRYEGFLDAAGSRRLMQISGYFPKLARLTSISARRASRRTRCWRRWCLCSLKRQVGCCSKGSRGTNIAYCVT